MSLRPAARAALAHIMAWGPASLWTVLALWRYGRSWPIVGLTVMVAVGIFGLTGVFLAWFPWTVERLGFTKLAAWLRTWWDEDAR